MGTALRLCSGAEAVGSFVEPIGPWRGNAGLT